MPRMRTHLKIKRAPLLAWHCGEALTPGKDLVVNSPGETNCLKCLRKYAVDLETLLDKHGINR